MSLNGLERQATHRAILLEEIRLIVRRHWWEFLVIMLVVTVYFSWHRFRLGPLTGPSGIGVVSLKMGSPWLGLNIAPLLYFLIGVYAALTLWRDFPPDRRSHLYSRPVDRASLNLIRVGIGGTWLALAILLGIYGVILIWTWGPVRIDQAGFVLGVLPPWHWLMWIVGVVNIYLVGSIIALLSRTPTRVTLLALLAIVTLWCLAAYMPPGIIRAPLIPLLPPDGLLGGIGITMWDAVGDDLVPAMAAPLMWFPILSAFAWLAARKAASAQA